MGQVDFILPNIYAKHTLTHLGHDHTYTMGPMDIVRTRAPGPIGHGNASTKIIRRHDLVARN